MILDKNKITKKIIDLSIVSGADLAGITSVKKLKRSPSYNVWGSVDWQEGAKSVLVLAVEHSRESLEMDWWDGKGGTIGNRILISLSKKIKKQIEKDYEIKCRLLPYHVEKGGVFLKDAAVLAGLGIIGKNNLLITPEYGSEVRLRAMFLDSELMISDLKDFDPCSECNDLCIKACPQNALTSKGFKKDLCKIEMKKNEDNKESIVENGVEKTNIKYCRACELVCEV